MPSLSDLFRSAETHYRAHFPIVDSLDTARALVHAVQTHMGEIENLDTGLLFTTPLLVVY